MGFEFSIQCWQQYPVASVSRNFIKTLSTSTLQISTTTKSVGKKNI